MNRLKNLSIPVKLTVLIGAVTTLALVVASVVFFVHNVRGAREAKVNQLQTLADVLASNSTAAISFGQKQAASDLLLSLRYYPTVTEAAILDDQGELFAVYSRNPASTVGNHWVQGSEGVRRAEFTDAGKLEVRVPILDGDTELGWICVRDSLEDLNSATLGFIGVSAFIVVLSLALGVACAVPMQRLISRPLLTLASAAQDITRDMDFSRRVSHNADDEIGALYRAFNTMIERVQQSTVAAENAREALETLNVDLEKRVKSRTDMLESANAALQLKMRESDAANAELKKTQTRLIEISRKAGMADIASGVLHNIGNVLNSLNIAASVVDDRVRKLAIQRLQQCASLLESHSADIGTFMSDNPKGRMIPSYLHTLAESMGSERDQISAEIASLCKHVEHIKEIVRAQQSYAGAFGVAERCLPHELVEDALRFVADSVQRHNIQLHKDYQSVGTFEIEKARLIQMLVNLIKNAKEAVLSHPGANGSITVRVLPGPSDHIRFEVRDTGVGISSDQLTSIFSHGFTTKSDGHGFGLHASANLAKELGGSLAVHSEGLGRGATFTIDVPRRPPRTTKSAANESPELGAMPVAAGA